MKLYRLAHGKKEYWETWQDSPGSHIVHWGELGSLGQTKTIKSSFFKKAEAVIQKEIDDLVKSGFAPVLPEDHAILLIEYQINGMGTQADLSKRHALEDRMNETLGWTGLGACDGGSIGSDTMEVCNFVVDYDIAAKIIAEDLAGTDFENYSRIYREDID